MPEPYCFTRAGRSRAGLAAVLATWGTVLLVWALFDAALWIMLAVLAFTLPALWDFAQNRKAGLVLDTQNLHWFSGKQAVDLPLTRIDHMRLDTRFDFSVRATAVLSSGVKMRLPQEATPPHEHFEAELNARAIRTERHHFSIF